MLEFVSSLTSIYCALCSSHIILICALYSSKGLLMFISSLLFFQEDTLLFSVVDMILYFYALHIDNSLLSYSNICLSYNLSQA